MKNLEMRQCPNGHFYYASIMPACPYCNPGLAPAMGRDTIGANSVTGNGSPEDSGGTIPPEQQTSGYGDRTQPPKIGEGFSPNGGVDHTVPPEFRMQKNGSTVAVVKKEKGFDPVVGWLVCCEGGAKGQDFRIRDGNNRIGRKPPMDIMIPDDDTITGENAAYLTYADGRYDISAGVGRNVIRLNNGPLAPGMSRELKIYDRIKIGQTELVFIPLCGENFSW